MSHSEVFNPPHRAATETEGPHRAMGPRSPTSTSALVNHTRLCSEFLTRHCPSRPRCARSASGRGGLAVVPCEIRFTRVAAVQRPGVRANQPAHPFPRGAHRSTAAVDVLGQVPEDTRASCPLQQASGSGTSELKGLTKCYEMALRSSCPCHIPPSCSFPKSSPTFAVTS